MKYQYQMPEEWWKPLIKFEAALCLLIVFFFLLLWQWFVFASEEI